MRRLTEPRGQERGAIAAIVAIVTGALVLTGVAALAVDAGSLYAERRVVQNGADAASLALAAACARGDVTKCSASSVDLTNLANLNSPDGFTDIDSVCGSTSPFAPCTFPASPRLKDCINLPASLPATAKWVEVRTTTRSTTADPTVVGKFFARLSDPSYHGRAVKACARAAWGPAGGLITVVPLTFSMCEWHAATGPTGTVYGNKPPFTASNPETPAREIALALNAPNDAACATWAGHDLPGGFAWLCHGSGCSPPSSSSCSIAVDGNGWVDVDTGIGAGSDCSGPMTNMVSRVVYLPIFDCRSKTKAFCDNTANGTKSFYHIKGYAAFFVTGVDINGQMKSFRSGYPTTAAKSTCTAKGGKCVYGWFLQDFLPGSAVITGGSSGFGLTVIEAVG